MFQSTLSTALDAGGTVSLVCGLCPHWSEQTSVRISPGTLTQQQVLGGGGDISRMFQVSTHICFVLCLVGVLLFFNFFFINLISLCSSATIIFGQTPTIAGEERLLASQPAHPIQSRLGDCTDSECCRPPRPLPQGVREGIWIS